MSSGRDNEKEFSDWKRKYVEQKDRQLDARGVWGSVSIALSERARRLPVGCEVLRASVGWDRYPADTSVKTGKVWCWRLSTARCRTSERSLTDLPTVLVVKQRAMFGVGQLTFVGDWVSWFHSEATALRWGDLRYYAYKVGAEPGPTQTHWFATHAGGLGSM